MRNNSYYFFIIAVIILLKGCATASDTIVVIQDAPRAVETQEAPDETEEFVHIHIGVLDPVTNFDPLYAENISTQRVISLIYETLFSLDRTGDTVPLIANSVEVSDDGLEYLITINSDIFYHDSQIFPAGLGRRIHARDIKWVFERSARSGLPPYAAELLMGVHGFENFYLEQREVYDQESRVLNEVTGIQVIDAETLVIQLNERDDHFIHKLASPFLSIYPPEAFAQSRDGLRSRAIGTGPYKFNRIDNDGKIVLIHDDREIRSSRTDIPAVNRVDVTHFTSETTLFQEFTRGNVDWIPELGPEIMLQVLDSNHNLLASYTDSYKTVNHNVNRVTAFYIHERSITPRDWLLSRLGLLTTEDFMIMGDITLHNDRFQYSDDTAPEEQYFVSFTDNLTARAALNEMHSLIFQPSSSLVFFDIRIPTRRTSLYSLSSNSFQMNWKPLPSDYWLRIDTRMISLYHNYIEGVQDSRIPWQLHIENIRVVDN